MVGAGLGGFESPSPWSPQSSRITLHGVLIELQAGGMEAFSLQGYPSGLSSTLGRLCRGWILLVLSYRS